MPEVQENPARGALLLVVPDPALALSLGRVAKTIGLNPVSALPDQSLEIAEREKPDLVVIDLAIAGDALALASELRGALGAVPILVITSDSRLPDNAREAGVVDFVTKPVDRELFATRLAFHLSSPPPASNDVDLDGRLRRLEISQALAGIGHWEWDAGTDEVRVSAGAAALLQLRDPLPRTLEELIAACVPPGDRQRFFGGLRDAVDGELVQPRGSDLAAGVEAAVGAFDPASERPRVVPIPERGNIVVPPIGEWLIPIR